MVVGSVLLATACGDDDDAAVDDVDVGAVEDVGSDDAEAEAEPEADNEAAAPGGGGGMLVLDGEEIELGPGLCFLEEQPSAGGGGSILATAQAQGTDAAGEEVRIDFTRYSEDSQFAGDDVSVDVGALGESVGYSGSDAEGTVSIDGNVVSATDFPLMSFDDGSEIAVTFTISC
tara:strand:+ start:242 stop:763 length:522 start_codon:yes stop_codon:yes gene_type:complete